MVFSTKLQKMMIMIETKIFDAENKPDSKEKERIVDFLYDNLEQYGDPKSDIQKAVDYALRERPSFGGFVFVGYMENEIVGIVVINETGMQGYIPENILVYIATHKNYRGKGIGRFLLQETIKLTKGSIALHVEPENPARFLYKKVGFTSKYIEMRFIK